MSRAGKGMGWVDGSRGGDCGMPGDDTTVTDRQLPAISQVRLKAVNIWGKL